MNTISNRPGIAPDVEKADTVRWIAQSYVDGLSLFKICRELEAQGVPTPSGGRRWHAPVLRTILRNPLHAGLIKHDGEYIKAAHYDHRIYDESVFYRILEEMGKRRKFSRTSACTEAPLARIAVCDECGGRLFIVHPDGKYRGYRCESTRRRGIPCNSRPYVPAGYLEPRIDEEIERIASDPELLELAGTVARRLLDNAPTDNETELAELTRELAQTEKKREDLSTAFARGEVSLEMLQAYDRATSERARHISSRLVELGSRQKSVTVQRDHYREVIETLHDFPRLWSAMSAEEKRAVYEMVIESLRIRRVHGKITVRLKMALLDEVVFDLPVHSQWNNARVGIAKPPITMRQRAYLALVAEGFTDQQIRTRWRVKQQNLRHLRKMATTGLGVSTIEEAVEKIRPELQEWKRLLPTEGRHGEPRNDEHVLTENLLAVLKEMAAGRLSPEIASRLGLPATTVGGRRHQLLEKLGEHSTEAAVARACELGLIGPDDPSPKMLLGAYKRLASGEYADHVKDNDLSVPTPRQMECLQALADGHTVKETAKLMGVGAQAVVYLRERLWRIVGATSLTSAIGRVMELDILRWKPSAEENER